MFSTDRGITWGNKFVIDMPEKRRGGRGSHAYTDSIRITKDKTWVFTSSHANIVGVLLERNKGVSGGSE